jgi:hypothetical protein
MFKRMSVVICGLAVMLLTAGPALAQGDAAADAATTAAVKTKLLGDTKVAGLNINVDTKDNVVTLTGKVKSAAERTEAVRLARTTTGVKDVVNKLTVDPTYDKSDIAKAERSRPRRRPATRSRPARRRPATRSRPAPRRPATPPRRPVKRPRTPPSRAKTRPPMRRPLRGEDQAAGRHEGRRSEDRRRHQGQRRDADRHGAQRGGEGRSGPTRRTTTGVKRVIDKLTVTPKL